MLNGNKFSYRHGKMLVNLIMKKAPFVKRGFLCKTKQIIFLDNNWQELEYQNF